MTLQFIHVQAKLASIDSWLAYQDEALSFGLKSVADAERLYDFWMSRDNLPEYCDEASDDMTDEEIAQYRVMALGYDPLEEK